MYLCHINACPLFLSWPLYKGRWNLLDIPRQALPGKEVKNKNLKLPLHMSLIQGRSISHSLHPQYHFLLWIAKSLAAKIRFYGLTLNSIKAPFQRLILISIWFFLHILEIFESITDMNETAGINWWARDHIVPVFRNYPPKNFAFLIFYL